MELKRIKEEINRLEIYKTDGSITDVGLELLAELKHTTELVKNINYDTLLASVISLGTNGMLQRLLTIRGYLIPADYKITDMALANKIITLEANS